MQNWWGVFRPWSYTATFIPVSLGAALAWNEGTFNLWLFLLTLAGGICVHAGTNLMNTYGDFITGVDTMESASHLQVVSGLISPEKVKAAGCTVTEVKDVKPWQAAVKPVIDKYAATYKEVLDAIAKAR